MKGRVLTCNDLTVRSRRLIKKVTFNTRGMPYQLERHPSSRNRSSQILAHRRRCFRQSGVVAIERTSDSLIVSRPCVVRGKNRIASWMSGARARSDMICVVRFECPAHVGKSFDPPICLTRYSCEAAMRGLLSRVLACPVRSRNGERALCLVTLAISVRHLLPS